MLTLGSVFMMLLISSWVRVLQLFTIPLLEVGKGKFHWLLHCSFHCHVLAGRCSLAVSWAYWSMSTVGPVSSTSLAFWDLSGRCPSSFFSALPSSGSGVFLPVPLWTHRWYWQELLQLFPGDPSSPLQVYCKSAACRSFVAEIQFWLVWVICCP